MRKRIIAMMLGLTLVLGMTACGAGKQNAASATPGVSASSDPASEASASSDPASEASAPSDPASEASTPESQASEEQPRGGGLPAAVEALLEKWKVQDFPEELYVFNIEFVGGIKDGQEYKGYEYDDDSDEIYRELYDTTPGTIRRLSIDSGPYQEGIASCQRTDPSEDGGWGEILMGTWSTHPDNDKFLELLLPDATGKMISYTAIAVDAPDESPDEPNYVDVILFQTDGGDSNVQFFWLNNEEIG